MNSQKGIEQSKAPNKTDQGTDLDSQGPIVV
jgi:hypothetical protein